MEKETRRKGIKRRQKQENVTDEKRNGIERRSDDTRRSDLDRRETESIVMSEKRKSKDRRTLT